MRKTKAQKGITLVALIITIIVLLILAVVAIRAVQNDGIIQYAKNARTDYEAAQARENLLLGNYVNYIKDNVGSSTGDEDSSGDTGEAGDTGDSTVETVTIGDYVLYTPAGTETSVDVTAYYNENQQAWDTNLSTTKTFTVDSTMKWKYMGTNSEGKILLVSDVPTSQSTVFAFKDAEASNHSDVSVNLDGVCSKLYSSSYSTARNMNGSDIEMLLGLSLSAVGGDTYGDNLTWAGTSYKNETDEAYKLVFLKDNGIKLRYFLSELDEWSWTDEYDTEGNSTGLYVVAGGNVEMEAFWVVSGGWLIEAPLRPVIVLNSGVTLGEKTADGWKLVLPQ